MTKKGEETFENVRCDDDYVEDDVKVRVHCPFH